MFINAWNEWAEAAHFELDRRYGSQFLEAMWRAIIQSPVAGAPYERFSCRIDSTSARDLATRDALV